MKEILVKYIQEKYKPLAIVLHGSRANGYAREHSDWDFLIFTTEDMNPTRDIHSGANIEIKQVVLPLSDEKIKDTFGFFFRTENIEVLSDSGNIVSELLAKNEAILKEGNSFGEVSKKARYAFLKSALDGMVDYKEDALGMFSKKTDFYDRVVPAWFRFLHREFKPSDYLALPRIKKDDPEFYDFLEKFVKGNAEESIESGNRMINHIFPDLGI